METDSLSRNLILNKKLINEENFDLSQNKFFFEPYPRFMGAVVPLPQDLQHCSESFSGKTVPLQEVVKEVLALVEKFPSAKVVLLSNGMPSGSGIIFLRLSDIPSVTHMFRLIHFRVP